MCWVSSGREVWRLHFPSRGESCRRRSFRHSGRRDDPENGQRLARQSAGENEIRASVRRHQPQADTVRVMIDRRGLRGSMGLHTADGRAVASTPAAGCEPDVRGYRIKSEADEMEGRAYVGADTRKARSRHERGNAQNGPTSSQTPTRGTGRTSSGPMDTGCAGPRPAMSSTSRVTAAQAGPLRASHNWDCAARMRQGGRTG
jgi:hypothetical protein